MDTAGMPNRPWDPGLQVERTGLAWVRTGIALVVVALLAFRFASPHGWPLTLVLGCGIAPLGLLSLGLGWRRYRTSAARLAEGGQLPGGGLMLCTTIFAVLTGVFGLVYVNLPDY